MNGRKSICVVNEKAKEDSLFLCVQFTRNMSIFSACCCSLFGSVPDASHLASSFQIPKAWSCRNVALQICDVSFRSDYFIELSGILRETIRVLKPTKSLRMTFTTR
ncbi:hypothetical protein KIL84_016793 [Mauremys mutica]|uniref:Uncharacterized protein n=1 Tax=Mauremys mutica TaxID=74926 RepID=A0A9D3X376_9SAUR|nr:hypothetical protein KIL84_016793 [Mauremys mutica]